MESRHMWQDKTHVCPCQSPLQTPQESGWLPRTEIRPSLKMIRVNRDEMIQILDRQGFVQLHRVLPLDAHHGVEC
jgi:hypothetical protein